MLRFILCKFDETKCPDWEAVLLNVNAALRQHGGSAMVIQDMDQAKRTIVVKESIAANLMQEIEREFIDSQFE